MRGCSSGRSLRSHTTPHDARPHAQGVRLLRPMAREWPRAAAPSRRARHYKHTNCARAADSLVFRASTASARATTMALHPAAHTHATVLPAARFLAKLCVDTLSAGTQSDANSWHSCSSITRPRTQCSTTRPRPTRSSTTPSARTRQRTGASSQAMPPCRCARTIAARTIVVVASRHLIAN